MQKEQAATILQVPHQASIDQIQDAYNSLITHAQDQHQIDTLFEAKQTLMALQSQTTEPVQQKKTNPNMKLYVYMGLVVLGFLLYSKFTSTPDASNANNKESLTKVQAPPDQPASQPIFSTPQPLIYEKPRDILNNIFYPDSSILQKPQLIYAPDGSIFPNEALVLPLLEQQPLGDSSIRVVNPRKTAIFGKLIVQYDKDTMPKLIRTFYIPSETSLTIFKIPSGQYQIQILTLDTPQAYVSPKFNISVGSEVNLTQVANWQSPVIAATLF